ncbi:MAG: ATP-binding protein, partial [Bacteroidota bacterium]|nr:ATP-binding protein [Bacteroidota bacterium]
ERSNEELEQFAFVASHDLQEPLRMISSFMDQLQRKYGDLLDEKGHEYIHFATDGAKRMKQIILDLLDYSRANKPTEGKEEVDMNEVLSEFKELRRKLISEKIASIKSGDLPTLNTYKAAITQILHCLLDNALKYSIEGTPPIVEIDVAEKEKEWEFSIKDNGIGIEPQFFGKIFIIFQRLHNRDEYKGTGIGLSIAKRHIEFLGGRIWLESAPGEGTVFYFTIPKIK